MMPLVSLRNFCEFSSGGKLKLSKRHYVPAGFPAFSAAGQDGYVEFWEHERPAIVVSSIGARCGKAFLAEGKWTSLANTYLIFPDVKRAIPAFIWYQLNDENSWIKSGSAQPFIKPSDIKVRRVALPPLDEQRRIVGILNRAAKIERLRARARELMGEFIPALFISMFGDPVENPMGWEEARICDLGSVGSGAGFPKKEQGTQGEQFPFLKVGDMNLPGNEISIRSWNNTVSDLTRQRLRAEVFPAGSVIFPKIGAAIATNKKRMLTCSSCVDNNVMAISPGVDMDGEWLYGLMLHKNLSDFASDADPPSMRKTTVEGWRIPCPPLDRQRRYARIVETVRSIMAIAESGYQTNAELIDALMSRVLGENE